MEREKGRWGDGGGDGGEDGGRDGDGEGGGKLTMLAQQWCL